MGFTIFLREFYDTQSIKALETRRSYGLAKGDIDDMDGKDFVQTVIKIGELKGFLQTVTDIRELKCFLQTVTKNDELKVFLQTIIKNWELKVFLQTVTSNGELEGFLLIAAKKWTLKDFLGTIVKTVYSENNVNRKLNYMCFQENNNDILRLCYNACSTYTAETNGNSIASTHSSIDGSASDLKCSELEPVTQRYNEIDADQSNIFEGIVTKLNFDDDNKKRDRKALEAKHIQDLTQTTTEIVVQETRSPLEDIDENVLLEMGEIQQEGNHAQETDRMIDDFKSNTKLKLEGCPRDRTLIEAPTQGFGYTDENVLFEVGEAPQEGKHAQDTDRMAEVFEENTHLKLDGYPRDRTLIQETSQAFDYADENVPFEVSEAPQEGKHAQDADRMAKVFEENTHLKLDGYPRDRTLIQETSQAFDYADENVPFEVGEAPQEGMHAQDTDRMAEVFEENTHLKLEGYPRDRTLIQETSQAFDYADENIHFEVAKTPKEEQYAKETARRLEDFDAETLLKLEDAHRDQSLIKKTPRTLGEVDAKFLEEDGMRKGQYERKDEETTIKYVDDSVTDNYKYDLVLEESNASLLDDSEIATTPTCILKSKSFEMKDDSYSIEIATQLLFEWLRGQEEVTCYYSMSNEIRIHVKRGDTDTSTIHGIIKTKFPQLHHIYRILHSDPGVCLPCASPTVWRSERGELVSVPSDDETIYAGREIFCRFLGSNVINTGTFSGKICGYGITAGHIAWSGSEIVHPDSIWCESQEIGFPILTIKNVHVPIHGTQFTREMLADLSFFRLKNQDSVINLFYGDPLNSGSKEIFIIVLHREPVKINDAVMVILKDEIVKFGRIASIDYNATTVSYTLYVVDENNRALTTNGDSGAILVLRPNRGDRNLRAIGVVTHLHCRLKPEFAGTNSELNSENSIPLGTIAIRLYEVLLATQQGAILGVPPEFRKIDLGRSRECVEFSGPLAASQQFDSGIQVERR